MWSIISGEDREKLRRRGQSRKSGSRNQAGRDPETSDAVAEAEVLPQPAGIDHDQAESRIICRTKTVSLINQIKDA